MSAPHLPRAGWRKSSYSQGATNCVEVVGLDMTVAVRDSKNPDGPALAFRGDAWRAFLHRIKAR